MTIFVRTCETGASAIAPAVTNAIYAYEPGGRAFEPRPSANKKTGSIGSAYL